jgi:glycosyltransferase involved in cell wall biosynthesis
MFFSIILPVYNREKFIARCLASVFAQDFTDFEIVLVDDGSSDGSLRRACAYADPRLHVLAHERNRGVGPARNTGIAAALGEWLVFLDSDDELVAGALAHIHEIARKSPPDVHAHWFRCRLDDGRLSPDPMPREEYWDYRGFIRFLDETRGRSGDMIRAVRRECFRNVRYPDSRMFEDKFHLDFARRYRSRAHADVLRLYHQDADNRFIDYLRRLDPAREQAFLDDRADGYRDLLREHGPAIAKTAPGQYADYLQLAAVSAIMANRHGAGLRYAEALAMRSPWRARTWLLLFAALLGPKVALPAWKLVRRLKRRSSTQRS